MTIYLDKRGREYLRVGETRSGVYAWYRPVEHADDGYYDIHRKCSEMRVKP